MHGRGSSILYDSYFRIMLHWPIEMKYFYFCLLPEGRSACTACIWYSKYIIMNHIMYILIYNNEITCIQYIIYVLLRGKRISINTKIMLKILTIIYFLQIIKLIQKYAHYFFFNLRKIYLLMLFSNNANSKNFVLYPQSHRKCFQTLLVWIQYRNKNMD